MIRAIAFLLAFACVGASPTYARDLQERWAKPTENLVPGAAEVNSPKLARDGSGNAILGGNSDDGQVWGWVVQKYDSQTGVLLWKDRYVPPSASETLKAVATDPAGNVFACGGSMLRKYRGTDGALLWETSRPGFSAGFVQPLAVDAAGNVLVTGTSSNPFTAADVDVIAFSGTDGAIRWQTRWTSPSNRADSGSAIEIGPTGDVFVAGHTWNGEYNNLVTLKIGAETGQIVWTQTSTANREAALTALACGVNGNVAVTGRSSSFPTPGDDIYVAVYSGAAGDLIWEKRYRGPNATANYAGVKALAMDAAGNVILSGFSFTSDASFFAGKYAAADGGMIWERVVSGTGEMNAIQLTESGDVVVAGLLQAPAYRNDFYLARFQGTDGAILWDEQIPGPHGKSSVFHAIDLDAAGNIFAAGATGRRADNDYCVAKYSVADGANLWTKTFDGLKHGEGRAQAVAVDVNGDVVSTGHLTNGENIDIYTEKRDRLTGALLWTRRSTVNGNEADGARAIATDPQGNVYVAGFTSDGVVSDGYVAKLRGSDGELIWQTLYAPTSSEMVGIYEIAVAPDGGVIVFGAADSVSFTAKFSGETGAILWEESVGDWLRGSNKQLVLDANGDVVIAGWIFPSSDYLTLKLSGATGEVLWQVRFNRDNDTLHAVAIDGNGDVVVTGRSSTAGPQNIYTAKYAGNNGALLWERYDSAGAAGTTLLAVDRDRNVYVLPRTAQNTGQRILKISPAGATLWDRTFSLPILSSSVIPVWAGMDSFGNLVTVGTFGNYRIYVSTFAATTGDRLAIRQHTDTLFPLGLAWSSVAVGADGFLAICEYAKVGNTERFMTRALITNTAPSITLVGEAQISIEASSLPYEDAGATVADVDEPSLVPTLTENTVQPGFPGSYHVKWSVTDSDGATASATRVVTVVDTTAPQIGSIADISITTTVLAGAVVTFDLSATDSVGVSELTSAPASGSVFPVGTTEVVISARDSAGNTATSRFFVTVVAAEALHRVIARSGGEVPGAGVDPRIPAGAKWRSFQSPALAATGEIAFVGTWTGAHPREKGFGLFRDDTLLAANRGETGTAEFKSIKDPVFRDGTSGLLVPVIRAGVPANADSALLEFPAEPLAAPVILAAESEQPIPGNPGRISKIVAAAGTAERAMIVAKLAGPGVTAKNDLIAYAVEEGEADVIVAGNGRLIFPAPWSGFRFLLPVIGTLGHGRHESHDGGARFLASFDREQDAIVKWRANDGWTIEAQTGMSTGAPGAENLVWKSFGAAASSTRDGEEFAFRARVAPAGTTAKTATDSIFWRKSTGMELVARSGATTFSEDASVLAAVSDPVLSGDGEVLAFAGKVKSGTKTVAAVFASTRDGEARVLARAGMPAPGLPAGVVFLSFSSLAVPTGTAGPLFVARLTGKPGYGPSVWAVDRNGDLRCVIRANEMIGVDVLKSFRILAAISGNSGSTRAFNDNRELVWLASFEKGASAVVKTVLP